MVVTISYSEACSGLNAVMKTPASLGQRIYVLRLSTCISVRCATTPYAKYDRPTVATQAYLIRDHLSG